MPRLSWKVHDCAQSFVLLSYTMHDYATKTETFRLVSSSVMHCARSRPEKRTKNTTTNFVEVHNHSPLLNMVQQAGGCLENPNNE